MTGIVEDLLTLARADSGQVEISHEVADLDELVRRAAMRSETLFASKGLSLVLRIEPGVIVIGDPGSLTQLVVNLLSNAARYTDNGGARVELSSGDGLAHLVVSDTGIGIPPEHLQRIFERFYRVDKARSRAAGGSGLGLAIARWVVTAHGGTISAQSRVGQGSEFHVLIPLAPTEESMPAADAEHPSFARV
jgi:signal transduction histidine kinase